jgi:hypothetical protein
LIFFFISVEKLQFLSWNSKYIFLSFFKSFKDEDAYTEGPEASSHSEYLAEDGTECIREARPLSGLCEPECSRQKAGSSPGLCVQGRCEKVLNEQTSYSEKGDVDKESFVNIICTCVIIKMKYFLNKSITFKNFEYCI